MAEAAKISAVQPEALHLLHRDETCVIVDKPHGVPAAATKMANRGTLAQALEAQQLAIAAPLATQAYRQVATASRGAKPLEGRGTSWGELHFKLLESLAPPSILVDAEHDIVHVSASAGQYLQYSGGEPSKSVLRAVHPSLRVELRAALYQAAQSQNSAEVHASPTDLGGQGREERGGRGEVDLAGLGKHRQEQPLALGAPAGEPLAGGFEGNAVEGRCWNWYGVGPSTALCAVPLPQPSWGRNGRKQVGRPCFILLRQRHQRQARAADLVRGLLSFTDGVVALGDGGAPVGSSRGKGGR